MSAEVLKRVFKFGVAIIASVGVVSGVAAAPLASTAANATGTVTLTTPIVISNTLTPGTGLMTTMPVGTVVANGAIGGLNGQFNAALIKWTDQATVSSSNPGLATINGGQFGLGISAGVGFSLADAGPLSSTVSALGLAGQGYMQIPQTNGATSASYNVIYQGGNLVAGDYVLKTTAIAIKS